MFRGKKYKEIAKQIDKAALYDPKEGLELICKTASAKFDETVELHVKLGVDSRHADQQVRGAIVLPNGTGKTARVLVFAKGDKAEAAKAAGADYVGDMDLVEKLAEQLCRKEVVIATETGCGVVPIDAAEREAREAAGRLSILLAKRAQKVIRVWCGLPESLR